MRRVLSAVALFVFLVAFAPVAYHFIASPSMILPEADRVEALCSQAASKLESKVLSVNRSTLLSVFSQRLLPVRPQGIHFEFYLVNSNPARGIFAWDFGRRVHPALHSSLAAVSRVLDVSVSAHSVLFAKLGGKPILDHVVVNSVNQTVAILGGAALKRIVNANSEWTTGSAVDASGRAVLRFAVIIPDPNIVKHPLYVKNNQGDLRKGFVQSRWGGVTFLQPSDEPQQSVAKELSDSDYSLLIDSVSAQISQFFGFNASAIDAYKPALEIEWTREHLQAACRSLIQTIRLTQTAHYMQVSQDVSLAMFSAVADLHSFIQSLESSDWSSAALGHIRSTRQAADIAAFHPDMMRHMYLPPEHVAALLLPFWVPFVTPLSLALITGISRHFRKAKLKQKHE